MTLSFPYRTHPLVQGPTSMVLTDAPAAPWQPEADLASPPSTTVSRNRELIRLTIEHGGTVTGALLDPAWSLFHAPGIPGVIGYRRAFRCAIALGDPVCPPAY